MAGSLGEGADPGLPAHVRSARILPIVLAIALACAPRPSDACSDLGSEFSLEQAQQPIARTGRAGRVHQGVTTASPDAQAYYDQGLAFLYAYQWIFAARSFHEALRLDPKLLMAELGLAKAYQGAQAFEEAERWLQRAEARADADGVPPAERAWVQLMRHQRTGALAPPEARDAALEKYRDEIDRLIALDGDDPAAWLLRGNAQERSILGRGQGGRETGLPDYQQALKLAPDHAGAHHFLVHSYENLGRLEEAAVHGKALVAAAPGAPHPIHMYAHVLPRIGRWREAMKWLRVSDRLHRAAIEHEGLDAADDWHFSHNLHLMGLLEIAAEEEEAGAAHLREVYEIAGRGGFGGFHHSPWIEYLLWKGRFEEALAAATETEAKPFPMAKVIGASLAGEAQLALGDPLAARAALDRGNAASVGLDALRRGSALELTLPWVAHRYTSTLNHLITLSTVRAPEASAALLEHADRILAGSSIDVWAGGRPRLQTLAAHARRAGRLELAAALAKRADSFPRQASGPGHEPQP